MKTNNYINEWKDYMRYNENLAQLSIDKYSSNVVKIAHTHDLINSRYFELASIIKELRMASMSLNTINNYIVSLKKYYSFLTDIEVIESNPSLKLRTFKIKKDDTKRRALNETQVNKLLSIEKKNLRDECFITLSLATGMRLNEICNVQLNNINYDTNEVTIIRKGGERRVLPINDKAMKSINNYINNERPNVDSNYLFLSNQKTKLSNRSAERVAKKYLKLVTNDIELQHTHTLRASFASMAIKVTDINTVRELMNHKQITTTQIYLDSSKESKRNATNNLF